MKTELHGFELLREQHIAELNTHARLFRHKRTGAELLSLENSDENKTFSVAFATPPADDTGLPHILEHSVLGGSRKYPVKEPFVELLKGSMKTFVNAMTADDITMYPVASQNLKDFYNLIDVYLDAVFYPTITEKTLQQEGWHYEPDGENGGLSYKGVVFNEMKGYYASPDELLGRYMKNVLLPDTPYAYDSGGDPAAIPDLTYAQFKRFHETYYHPSNARFLFYGDDTPEERLRLVDSFIAEFEHKQVDASVPKQPRWAAPRKVVRHYPVSEQDDENRTMAVVSWLLDDVTDGDTMLALHVLEHILIETPASPLRKVLIDSGLGEDVAGGGLDSFRREAIFSAGLKGIASQDAATVEALVLQTLGDLAENGIDPGMVAAAMNTTEFALRENNAGWAPRGLLMMYYVLPAWRHGGDPLGALAFEAPLERLKARLAAGERVFEDLIGKYFLDNPHRSTVILEPDATVRQQWDEAEQARLAAEQARMTSADLERVKTDAADLKRMQETPDAPEALATIPRLSLDDLDKTVKTVPIEVLNLNEATVLYHDLPTSGIIYLDLALDLHTLPANLLPYVDLFGRALTEMGTRQEDFVQLAQRIGQQTGGIGSQVLTSSKFGGAGSEARLLLRGKAFAPQTGVLLDILRDVLLDVKLDNQERFMQMVLEEKAGLEASLGSIWTRGYVDKRVRAHFEEAAWADEQMGGISYLFFVRQLAERVERDWAGVLHALETVRETLVNRSSMVFNVTLEAEHWQGAQAQLTGLIDALPQRPVQRVAWTRADLPRYEGLTMTTQVNYVGKAANLYALGYSLHGSYHVALQAMNLTYMWEHIRVKGGAYGGRGAFDPFSGVFGFLSWQDPNIARTLETYDHAGKFLQGLQLSQDELTRSIIGAISNLDPHLLPDAKGFQSLLRYLLDYSDEQRQQIWTQVLNTTVSDIQALGAALEQVGKAGVVAVAGSPEAIDSANRALTPPLHVTKVI